MMQLLWNPWQTWLCDYIEKKMPAESSYEFQDLTNEIPANANLKQNYVFIEILFYFYESLWKYHFLK